MLKSNLNYPYPMLRSTSIDYRTSVISSSILLETTSNAYELNVSITTNNDNINNLLEEGKLITGILVKSNAVWYRKFYPVKNGTIIIDAKDIYGKVDLLPCIVSTQEINDFFSPDFEDEFKYSKISIGPGEIIGLGEELCFDALLDSDIFKNTSSIFEMVAVDDNNLSYDLNNDKIVIFIPREMHKNYINVANSTTSTKSILNSIIVFPVLVSVLYDIRNFSDDEDYYENKKWYKTIKKTIESKSKNNLMNGLDSLGNIENPILVAQCLTSGLTMTYFMNLKYLLEFEGE